ncbi:cytidylyltransferase domain-containing protein [Psychrobacillus psychrodurans]|uniref:Acylneuraminate cytidylyltransferase family protein n=1 Tax=Psychrobacillus psychrodurans TaxID=126157 RepID=A0A9X3L5K2_9BACI|nr:acylneuraminate cytidylyltransferase family protein [Psychrobacillus psychrodurans]MCZ8531818.1 acylneuraminate cytidylyltransferase family protein [Psychrobacillus psychrodurans]
MKPTFLAVIPARGGSKGVPRKNIKELGGRPLIAWTIEEAKKSKFIDRIILSSEDAEIIEVAKEYDCDVPFTRPVELAQDETPGIVPILHAIEQCSGYDFVVLLQPTSPLRTVEDIDGAIETLIEREADFCVSVTEPDQSPYWMYNLDVNGTMSAVIKQDNLAVRRQDLPKIYSLNGAVYVANIEKLEEEKSFLTNETIGYVMPKQRSIDIDTEEDFYLCEQKLRTF